MPARRPVGWLAQRDANDCGVASLTMAARGHGLDVTPERVRSLLPLGEAGANMQALAGAAGALGLRATAVRITAEQLSGTRLPAVAHLARGHYVAVFELRPEGVIVADPATGVRTVPVDEFRRGWSGHLLLLAPAS